MRPARLVRRITAASGAALITTHLLAAQVQRPPGRQDAPPAPSATGLIFGTVVDAGSSEGVPGAVVSLSGGALAAVGLAQDGTVVSTQHQLIADDKGRFVFRDLPPGRYNFNVAAQGYTRGGYGVRRPNGPPQPFELAEGAKVNNVALRIWKLASISGRVLDDAGDPIVQATVDVSIREFVAGQPRLRPAGSSVRTDDRGLYRATGLVPGDYIVGIVTSVQTMPASIRPAYDSLTGQARSDFMNQLGGIGSMELLLGLGTNTYRIGDLTLAATSNGLTLPPPTSDGRILVYQTTYHPDAAAPAAATSITLTSGEDRRGVDLTAKLVPSVIVSGTLTGPDGVAGNVGVALVRVDASQFLSPRTANAATTATDADGRFTFLGVAPGAYTVEASRVPRAPSNMVSTSVMVQTPTGMRSMGSSRSTGPAPLPTEPAYFATRAITVGGANVANVALQFQAAGRMTGRVEFDGTTDRPPADLLARMTVSFESVDGSTRLSAPRGQIDGTGAFATTGIMPGRYAIRPLGISPGWTLESAMWQGHDLIDEPFVADGSDISGVIMTFTDHAAQLTGVVRDAKGGADASATVLFFTTDRKRWANQGGTSRVIRSARVSTTGTFTLTGMPPGDYFVVAVDDAAVGDWQDPKRLEASAGLATRVTIAAGDRRSVDLKAVVVR